MNFLALLLPVLLVGALYVGLAIMKRRLSGREASPRPTPAPDPEAILASLPQRRPATPRRSAQRKASEELSLVPARLYPRRALTPAEMTIFSRLLKSLPGYVVLPKMTYDHFLEARDGSASENTSLQNRAAAHLADFLVCDKKLNVLLVCQIEDGSQVPARIQEREKMLQKSGLRLLRWNIEQPPEPAALLATLQTLERMRG